jgi:outer membrane receptor protein involved in Fe transport
VRQDDVRQLLAGAFGRLDVRWSPTLRGSVGLRADRFEADVDSDRPENSGSRGDSIASPKLGLAFGPWSGTEIYANWGMGHHSNDARGTLTRLDPVSLEAVPAADPLVRTEGADVGVRTSAIEGLHASASLFWLRLDSELVFVGDAGTTEPGPPSRRTGIEVASFWRPRPWLAFDLDLTRARAQFTGVGADDRVPGALEETVAAGLALGGEAGWSGALRWRYFGSFPLNEAGTERAPGSSLLNGRLGYAFRGGLTLTLDGFNLLDREDADIRYFYASRLPASLAPGGVAEDVDGVEGVHFHPTESRTLRLGIEYAF